LIKEREDFVESLSVCQGLYRNRLIVRQPLSNYRLIHTMAYTPLACLFPHLHTHANFLSNRPNSYCSLEKICYFWPPCV